MRISDWSSDVCSSDLDVEAPRTVDFIDHVSTEELRQRAARNIQPVYTQSAQVNEQARQVVLNTFATIARARAVTSSEQAEDRRSVVTGQIGSVRVDLGGSGISKKNKQNKVRSQ